MYTFTSKTTLPGTDVSSTAERDVQLRWDQRRNHAVGEIMTV